MIELMEDGGTLRSVGEEFGITRERVRQILVKVGYTNRYNWVKSKKPRTCPLCGDTYIGVTFQQHARDAAHSGHPVAYARYEAIGADYRAGMLLKDLMEKYHCKQPTIYRAVRRLHLPTRRPQTAHRSYMTKTDWNDILTLSETMTDAEIGKRYGVSNTRISQIRHGAGMRKAAGGRGRKKVISRGTSY